jgi:hypothetical protein
VALSQREKYIAIGVGAAIVLWIADSVVISPYRAKMDQLQKDTADADATQVERTALFGREPEVNRIWSELTHGGLSTDVSAAESQSYRAVVEWAGEAGVQLTALKQDSVTNENVFQVSGFHVTATGSTSAIGNLMWDIETATIPVRLTDVQIVPRKEGTDDLTVQFGVSTLCRRPDAPDHAAKPAAAGVTAAANGEIRS